MTLLILGTYRGPDLVQRALSSISRRVTGVTEIVLVDDSPARGNSERLKSRFGHEVISLGGQGYNVAMKTACERAGDEAFVFWEEDFVATHRIDVGELAEILDARPHLAQVALLRQPWFANEVKAGGLIQALQARGEKVELVDGVYETPATFTCNPALWRAGIAATGWPDGAWSEDAKRDELIEAGYSFGFLDGVRVFHNGKRSGHGY